MGILKKLTFAVACGALSGAASAADRTALMPLPRSLTPGPGKLAMAGEIAITVEGCGDRAVIDRAGTRLRADIVRQTGLTFDAAKSTPVAISCRNALFAPDRAEGYRLAVSPDGVRIDADGPAGVLRGMATLRQLVGLSPNAVLVDSVVIEDAPRFAWRGVMLDVARHFIAVQTLERQLDAMERVKLNVLHLHLSDDQGFRVESRSYPKLNSGGAFYTQAQIRALVHYAMDRGVRIVPEFDVPGHSRAIVEAYPAIGIKAKPTAFGVDVALNPAKPETYRFLQHLFGEMSGLFPDRYFHVGGDEIAKGIWDQDEAVADLKKRQKLTDAAAVERYFHLRLHDIVTRLGKTMIGWEEVTGSRLPTDTTIQAWQTSNATASAVGKGHPTIVSAGYYLDLLMPAEFSYTKDPADTSAAGLSPDRAATLRKKNPLLSAIVTDALVAFPRPPLTPSQEKMILGGEAPLWSELVTDELVDDRLWPRAAAMAERFWSPRDVRDVDDMYRRLAIVGDQLTTTGLEDRATRNRMALRLSPGDTAPVETLLTIVGPVRNMAHNLQLRAILTGKHITQSFNALADAAPADSLVARRFAQDAASYAGGDKAKLLSLRALLSQWHDNDLRFVAAAKGRPLLEAAIPASAQIAALAAAGLGAIDAIEAGRRPDTKVLEQWQQLLSTVDAQEAASAFPLETFLKAQPPADLIVKIGPGVKMLVDAASRSN